MTLTSFTYKESGWELSSLEPLRSVNLLVGRNATGKSRTVRALQIVKSFMLMKDYMFGVSSFSTEMLFEEDADWKMQYSFQIKEGVVEREYMSVCGKELIKRTKSTAKYNGKKINPPATKLVAQVRRDNDLFPEIEKLMLWAEGILCVSCSDINPYTVIATGKVINPFSFCDLVEKLSVEERKRVIANAVNLGYKIGEMKTIEAGSDMKFVQVKETNVSKKLIDLQLSSGMLRTLYLLCFMEYVKTNKKPSLLLIDDLGEGLDYGRSTGFGRMIFEECENVGIQLIASSNDAFLMDVVDIACWQVLRREKSKVTTINQNKCPELFRKFRMTGLSNFDLFSSDFIDKFFIKQSQPEQ